MRNLPPITLKRIVQLLTCVLICKVTVSVLLNYGDYLPPNFTSDFLHGREYYFFGSYAWAFYAHIFSGPCTLILGLILLSQRFRLRYPQWHRCLGRIQVVCVVFLVAPSGLWMARHSETGDIAGAGFASLAVVTGMCAALGWRAALKRRFVEHRRWMWRCYVLLCSAVVLRVQGGLATVFDVESRWQYPVAAWTSWLLPILVLELMQFASQRRH